MTHVLELGCCFMDDMLHMCCEDQVIVLSASMAWHVTVHVISSTQVSRCNVAMLCCLVLMLVVCRACVVMLYLKARCVAAWSCLPWLSSQFQDVVTYLMIMMNSCSAQRPCTNQQAPQCVASPHSGIVKDVPVPGSKVNISRQLERWR
jgi:hypothetical protein